MARPSQILRFEVELSDVDGGTYETLSLRVAQHPSETEGRLLTRIIAYCLHVGDGIEFSKGGLSNGDEPALFARDLTGQLTLWVDVGSPAAERLHKASKLAERVVVYGHKGPTKLLESLRGARIHRAEDLELYALEPAFLSELAGSLGRNNQWSLMRSDGVLFVTGGECSVSCALEPLVLEV